MRSIISLAIPAVFGIAGSVASSELQAQAFVERRVSATAIQVAALSQERAEQWARTAPLIRCAPAPVSERPGAAAELQRPHIAPLEAAFLDAQKVKRSGLGSRLR